MKTQMNTNVNNSNDVKNVLVELRETIERKVVELVIANSERVDYDEDNECGIYAHYFRFGSKEVKPMVASVGGETRCDKVHTIFVEGRRDRDSRPRVGCYVGKLHEFVAFGDMSTDDMYRIYKSIEESVKVRRERMREEMLLNSIIGVMILMCDDE